MSKDETQVSL